MSVTVQKMTIEFGGERAPGKPRAMTLRVDETMTLVDVPETAAPRCGPCFERSRAKVAAHVLSVGAVHLVLCGTCLRALGELVDARVAIAGGS